MNELVRCSWRGLNGDALYEAYHDNEWGTPERNPEAVARFGEADRARLLEDASIVRSPAKIDAAIRGARLYLDMREQGEDFSEFLWSFVGGEPIQNAWTLDSGVPAKTAEAEAMSKALKARGFNFVGPVIVYAFMQAVGMVNAHLTCCSRHEPIRHMAQGR